MAHDLAASNFSGDELARVVALFLGEVARGAGAVGAIERVAAGRSDLVSLRQIVPRALARLSLVARVSGSRETFFNFDDATMSNTVARISLDAEIVANPDDPPISAHAPRLSVAAWPRVVAADGRVAVLALADGGRATIEVNHRGEIVRAWLDAAQVWPVDGGDSGHAPMAGFATLVTELVRIVATAAAETSAHPASARAYQTIGSVAPLVKVVLDAAAQSRAEVAAAVVEATSARDAIRYALARLEARLRVRLGADGRLVAGDAVDASKAHDLAGRLRVVDDAITLRLWPGGGVEDDQVERTRRVLDDARVRERLVGRLHRGDPVLKAGLDRLFHAPTDLAVVQMNDAESWVVHMRGELDGAPGEVLVAVVFDQPPLEVADPKVNKVPLAITRSRGVWSTGEESGARMVAAWMGRLVGTSRLLRAIGEAAG